MTISTLNLEKVGRICSNFKEKHIAANLTDVLRQTEGGWALHCEILNTVTDGTPDKDSGSPFSKLQKIKKKLNGTGL